MKMEFYGSVLASNGEEYTTHTYRDYTVFERVCRNYIGSPDCVRVDAFKIFPDGQAKYIGAFRRTKKGRPEDRH